MTKWILVAVALAVGAGCMPAVRGTQVSREQLERFQNGVTTESEVVSLLGPPMMTTVNSDGTRVIVYGYANLAAKVSQGTTFVFGKDGRMTSYHASESNYGALAERPPAKPVAPDGQAR